MKKMKTLCKVKKSHYTDVREEVIEAVTRPQYICEQCLRVVYRSVCRKSPEPPARLGWRLS